MAKKPYDEFVPEIRELADSIKTQNLVHIRDIAHKEWLADCSKDTDMTARAWVNATLIVLAASGYEIKKKS